MATLPASHSPAPTSARSPSRRRQVQPAYLLRALAHPQRLHIAAILAGGDECVCHLTVALGLRQATVSQHLATLRRAGAVRARRDGPNTYYRLADPRVVPVLEALGISPTPRHGRLAGCNCPRCDADRPG